MVLVHTFFFLGQGITNETVDLLDDVPGIISSSAKILRLWDDLGSAKVTYNLVMNLFLFKQRDFHSLL